MYYHDTTPQASEAQDDEQDDDELAELEDRLVAVMADAGAPVSEATKAVHGKVRQGQ